MSNAENSSLPTGWEACCFGDIARIRNGYAFKSELFKKSRAHETDVPLIRQSQMKGARIDTSDAVFLSGDYLKKHPDYVIAKGDVIIGMSGSIGKVCLYAEDFPALQNQRTGKIVPHLVSELNPKFFGLFLSNIERELTEYAKGMGVQNISSKDIEQLPFNLPPKNEQHRIVAKIEELFSELDKGIENLKTARAQLKVYRQALLKHAFEGKLTAQWRAERNVTPAKAGVQPLNDMDSRLRGNDKTLETADVLLKRIQQARAQRYQHQLADWEAAGGSKPKAPKPLPPLTAEELAELPELPEGWGWVRLDHLIADSTLGIDRGSQYQRATPPGVPYIKMNNVTMDGRITFDRLVYVDADREEQNRYALEEGDILFNTRNSKELVGKTGLVRGVPSHAIYNNNLMRIRVHEHISPKFICHQMCSTGFRQKMEVVKKATTNVAAVYAKDLFPLVLALAPAQEQTEIALQIEARLFEVDQLELTITTSLQQAEALRQSILKKAFSGQLVPQDPHDEPASELLNRIKGAMNRAPTARIKAERAGGEKSSAVRQRGKRG